MAKPRNQHCANCIGTLSFPVIDSQMHEPHGRGILKSKFKSQSRTP